MAKKVFHKRSSVLGQMPTGDTLSHGEIAVNFNSAEPFLSIKDSEGKYVKFSSDEAYLQGDKVLSDKYDELYALVDENEEITAQALTNLDERLKELKESSDDYITADEVVLANAKLYADSKAKEIEDAYVLADNAILVDAKGYTDEKIAALPETYTKDEVDNLIGGVQENLTNEVKAREDAVTNLTDEIIKNELVISNSLNDLNTRVNGVKETVDNLDFTSVVEEAKSYTDSKAKEIEDAYVLADNAILVDAKGYTDSKAKEIEDALTDLTNEIIDNEEVVAAALTDLDARINNWIDGMNTATSLTNIPITKRMCKVTVSESATLTVTSGLAAGRELHILIYNSGSSAITVTMPTSGYVNFGEEAITIPSNLYAEVNILSDGSTYFIKMYNINNNIPY